MDHQAHPRRVRVLEVLLAALLPVLGGCLERELKPLNPCLVSGVAAEVKVSNVDKIDLLFMVDNSNSMRDEQRALAIEFPKLINVLTSGDRTQDGVQDFPPVKDLHLGVVSSDLGLGGINSGGCTGFGDDGILQGTAAPDAVECSASTFTPPFLTYRRTNNDDPAQLAKDFKCIATLGVDGCGFEQQLESVLKAVWPRNDPRVSFVKDQATGFGMSGNAGPGAPNGDFIRNDPNESPSLIALVLVTDEEDCSSNSMEHFLPDANEHGLNTRCFFEGQEPEPNNLYDVHRYVDSFKALRPGNENLVIFAGIVGVPQRLVTEQELAKFDFSKPAEADAFFDGLLAAPEMQETLDTKNNADPADDNLKPSCDRGTDARAFPPRRIVQVAKGFGANAVIQSICQEGFGPAMDAIIAVIVNQLDSVCLPRPLVRNHEGLVECNVIWELPPNAMGDTPTECAQRSFLLPPDPGHDQHAKNGGAICKVAQLAVVDLATPNAEGETMMPVATLNDGVMIDQGWYYDEFSKKTQEACAERVDKQRIGFSPLAEPPTGVNVKLECLNETQRLANTRTDLMPNTEQPSVGSPCKNVMLRNATVTDDEACVVVLAEPVNGSSEDRSMFCHAETQVCVEQCTTAADCPDAWVCDTRPESVTAAGGRAFCTNPTCGSSQE
jgi:hypothetical protein